MSEDSTVVHDPLCELITLKLSRPSMLEKPEKQTAPDGNTLPFFPRARPPAQKEKECHGAFVKNCL